MKNTPGDSLRRQWYCQFDNSESSARISLKSVLSPPFSFEPHLPGTHLFLNNPADTGVKSPVSREPRKSAHRALSHPPSNPHGGPIDRRINGVFQKTYRTPHVPIRRRQPWRKRGAVRGRAVPGQTLYKCRNFPGFQEFPGCEVISMMEFSSEQGGSGESAPRENLPCRPGCVQSWR